MYISVSGSLSLYLSGSLSLWLHPSPPVSPCLVSILVSLCLYMTYFVYLYSRKVTLPDRHLKQGDQSFCLAVYIFLPLYLSVYLWLTLPLSVYLCFTLSLSLSLFLKKYHRYYWSVSDQFSVWLSSPVSPRRNQGFRLSTSTRTIIILTDLSFPWYTLTENPSKFAYV